MCGIVHCCVVEFGKGEGNQKMDVYIWMNSPYTVHTARTPIRNSLDVMGRALWLWSHRTLSDLSTDTRRTW